MGSSSGKRSSGEMIGTHPVVRRIICLFYRFRRLRGILTRLTLKLERGENFSITYRGLLAEHHGITLGDYSYGLQASVLLPRGTVIGRYVSLGPELLVFRRNHPKSRLSLHPAFYNKVLAFLPEDTLPSLEENPLTIESDVWIGARTTILPSCKRIGVGSIVGAGSVVTRDIGDFEVFAGNPARKIGQRFDAELAKEVKETAWWQLPLTDLIAVQGISSEEVDHALLSRLP